MTIMDLEKLKENPHKFSYELSVKKLSELVNMCAEKYYTDDPIISDLVYDQLLEILEKRDPSNMYLKNVGFKGSEDKVKIPIFMGSMDKVKTFDGIKLWLKRFNNISKNEYVISEKLDGISACIKYEKDNITIFSRGNGEYGRDISFLKKFISIPKINFEKYDNCCDIMVRGELIISKKSYDKYNHLYNSPRNMVNGLVNIKDTINDKFKLIDFVLFEVIKPKLNPLEQFKFGGNLGFKVSRNKLVKIENITNWVDIDNNYLRKTLDVFKKTGDYDIDGIIITHNDIYDRVKGNPKQSIAFKSNNMGVVTVVKDIIWTVSKYNVIIPRIYFEKIDLGSNVEYCTGFSGKYIFNNCLGPGSKIRVVLSGEVIPYVVEVIKSTYPKMPNINYDWNSTKIHCIALDINTENEIKRINHFIKTLKIDNISEKLIKKLHDNGFNTLDKILLCTKQDLIKVDGFKDTLASKIFNNINSVISKPIKLSTLMVASLQFDMGFGMKRISKIVEIYPDIMNKNITIDDIIKIEGFQIKTAKQFVDNLKKFKQFLENNTYLKYFVDIKLNNIVNNYNENIKDKKFVITGFRNNVIQTFIQENSGIIQNSISKKTDMLIIKNKEFTSSKVSGAELLGIKIITQDEFVNTYMK